MKKAEVWSAFLEKYPVLKEPGKRVSFTQESLYNFFSRVWDVATEEVFKNADDRQAFDFLKDTFGMK